MNQKKADLHMHTTASDGTDNLEKRVKDAKKKGLDTIAITDHDKINESLKKESFIAENGVEVITGAEIKCQVEGKKIEILCYFLNPEGENLQELLEELTERRKERMEKFVGNLNQSHGLGLELQKVLEKAEGNVGRPHLAETVIEKGYADSHQEAFGKFIGSENKEYVPVEKVSAGKVIKTIHQNGGKTSLAHPGRSLTRENAEEHLDTLKNKGLDGLEVKYTYDQKKKLDSYTINFGINKASELAEKFNLVKTGGSDCHGSGSNKYFLGDVKLPYSRLEDLHEV